MKNPAWERHKKALAVLQEIQKRSLNPKPQAIQKEPRKANSHPILCLNLFASLLNLSLSQPRSEGWGLRLKGPELWTLNPNQLNQLPAHDNQTPSQSATLNKSSSSCVLIAHLEKFCSKCMDPTFFMQILNLCGTQFRKIEPGGPGSDPDGTW